MTPKQFKQQLKYVKGEQEQRIRQQAQEFEAQANSTENDLAAFSLYLKADRERRMADFLQQLESIRKVESVRILKEDTINSVFIFDIDALGVVDFWPKKPCLRIRKPQKYFYGEKAFLRLLELTKQN